MRHLFWALGALVVVCCLFFLTGCGDIPREDQLAAQQIKQQYGLRSVILTEEIDPSSYDCVNYNGYGWRIILETNDGRKFIGRACHTYSGEPWQLLLEPMNIL